MQLYSENNLESERATNANAAMYSMIIHYIEFLHRKEYISEEQKNSFVDKIDVSYNILHIADAISESKSSVTDEFLQALKNVYENHEAEFPTDRNSKVFIYNGCDTLKNEPLLCFVDIEDLKEFLMNHGIKTDTAENILNCFDEIKKVLKTEGYLHCSKGKKYKYRLKEKPVFAFRITELKTQGKSEK